MDDKTPASHSDEIDVEEIMARIRENIHCRQAAGALPSNSDLNVSALKTGTTDISDNSFQRDLSIIHSLWDIRLNSYVISSHRPYIGKILVRGRQLLHGEVRRYVDPIIFRQSEFNASSVRILSQTSQKCAEINANLDNFQNEIILKIDRVEKESRKEVDRLVQASVTELNHYLTTKIDQDIKAQRSELIPFFEDKINQKTEDQKAELIPLFEDKINRKIEDQKAELIPLFQDKINRKIEDQKAELIPLFEDKIGICTNELLARMDFDIHSRAWLNRILEERVQKGLSYKGTAPGSISHAETNYFLFEEHFRGSREDIKQRQLAFLPYFENCSRVLDIGCGRGEFLEILKDHSIGGIGVDVDADMVAYCKSRQLEAEQGDAIDYLEKLEDKSLDGIFIDQVVEHLEPGYLVRLLALCHQKLKFGYYIVVETVNPLSFASFVNFYIDLTHKKPVHPLTLNFLIESAGFRSSEIKYYSEIPDLAKLQKIPVPEKISETEQNMLNIYNHNIEQLNNLMYGPRDYAIIGKK